MDGWVDDRRSLETQMAGDRKRPGYPEVPRSPWTGAHRGFSPEGEGGFASAEITSSLGNRSPVRAESSLFLSNR